MTININTPDQFAKMDDLAQPLGGDTFLISLSGVAIADFNGQPDPGTDWFRDVAQIQIPLQNALSATKRVPRSGFDLAFSLQQWTSLFTPNAFAEAAQAPGFGVAIDTFQVNWEGGAPLLAVPATVNLASRANSFLIRIGYMLILIGNVAEVPVIG